VIRSKDLNLLMRAEGRKEMKDENLKHKENEPCTVKYSPVPEFVTCPNCGFEIELWSEDEETRCLFCGHKVFKREATVH
jgi:hypothetical protein